MTGRRRDVHGPVTGGAHVALAPSLDRLVGAHSVAEVLLLRVLGADRCAEFVIEAFLREVTLLFCDPLLQSEVRRDDERGHGRLPSAGAFTRDSTLFLAGALSSSGLDEPAPRDIEALEPSRVVSMKQVANVRAVLVRDDAPAVDLLPS